MTTALWALTAKFLVYGQSEEGEFMWTAISGVAKIDNANLISSEKQKRKFSMEPSEVTLLVHKASTGNRFAFNQLIQIFQDDIFKMVFYRIRSHLDAEDLTQDIFLQAYKNLSKLKSMEKFKSWLFSIAINRVRDFYRKKRFRDMFLSNVKTDEEMILNEGQQTQTDPIDGIYKKDFWRKVESILKKLPTMEREVFTLRFMDTLNINEISSVLGKSESTVKTHLYRALGKFKKESSLLRQFKEVYQ